MTTLPLPESRETQCGAKLERPALLLPRCLNGYMETFFRRGDIVLALNNHDIKSVEQLNQLMSQYERSRSVALLVKRGDGAIYVPIRLDGN